jgi:CrcB protein
MGLAENRSTGLLMAPTDHGRSAMRFVWVGLAGAVGSVARYAIGLTINQSSFPWATLGINLSGSLLLGFFLTVALGQLPVRVITPIAVGLIGGFTTFSTFAWDGFTIGRGGRVPVAALYVVVSVVGGLAMASVGYLGGRAVR